MSAPAGGVVMCWAALCQGGGDGAPEVPEVQQWGIDSTIRLRPGGGFGPVQSVGVYQSRVWILPAGGQRGSQLRQED